MHRGWRRTLAAVAIVSTAAVAQAQPSGSSLVSGDPLTAFRVSSPRATAGVVEAAGPGFSRVFGVGGFSQGIEIGGIEVIGFGPGVTLDMLPPAQFTYAGRAADDPWRAEAAARIDAIRKGDLVIEVVDDGREGLEDAEVRVEQRRHTFPFGSALQAARLTAGAAPDGQPDDNAAYRHI